MTIVPLSDLIHPLLPLFVLLRWQRSAAAHPSAGDPRRHRRRPGGGTTTRVRSSRRSPAGGGPLRLQHHDTRPQAVCICCSLACYAGFSLFASVASHSCCCCLLASLLCSLCVCICTGSSSSVNSQPWPPHNHRRH